MNYFVLGMIVAAIVFGIYFVVNGVILQKKQQSIDRLIKIFEETPLCIREYPCEIPLIRLHWHLFSNHLNIKGEITMVQLKSTQSVNGILQPVDRKGNAAPIEPGTVKFSSSDESVFTVEQDETHETKVKVVAVAPGVAVLNFEADADLGEGVKTISGSTGVEVVASDAVGFGVTFEAPVEVELPQSNGPVAEQPASDAGTAADNTTANDNSNASEEVK